LKKLFLILTGISLCLSKGIPQNVSISGIPNHYLQVNTLLSDRVLVTPTAELGFFNPGDKVMLIQMTGAQPSGPETYPDFLTNRNRSKKAYRNTGKFEILQVYEVITGADNYVVFTDNIFNTYNPGEKLQLVRMVDGDNVTVTGPGPLRAKPWDGNTGGIIAILAMDTLKLETDISADTAGFRGGLVPAENYTGGCRHDISSTILDTLYFLPAKTNRSGNKGEGITTVAWPYTKGAAYNINGGGAGNGLYAGGAGGSNYNVGGNGGQQSAFCTAGTLSTSWGGYACGTLYYLNDTTHVIMGGGGGSGVRSATNTATKGGNGGGLVVILTGTLSGGGKTISANGQSVAGAATGSGGGGGAGGTVLIDASGFAGNFSVKVRGGNGGRTNGSTCTGSGGAGGGGVFWHFADTIPSAITVDLSAGNPGTACNLSYTGEGTFPGTKLNNLLTPLNGFLFNTIRGVDTSVCEGQVPGLLRGSLPKGGDGTYEYHWEQSTNKAVWSDAQGTADLRTLQPPALTQTTWYRRVIVSDFIYDTSSTLKVFVYPAITSNTVSGTDTICYDVHAATLSGTNPSGGNGTFAYQWQYSTNQTDWNTGAASSTYDPGQLMQSRYFRRIVTSAQYCSHTSNTVKITVLTAITNNSFESADTVLCKNQGPGLLNVRQPANGDGIYSYLWQSRSTHGSWAPLASSNVMRYNPGILTDTTLYRRIVYSGNGMACKDTSAAKTVDVLPLISNNLPSTTTNRYCAGKIPALISGTQPLGGNLVYSYQWMKNTSGTWDLIPGAILKDYTPDHIVDTTIRFSRVVLSGANQACRDTSAALLLTVVPYIHNSLASADQTICENGVPVALTVTSATGGFGGFSYQWIMQQAGSSGWSPATGLNNQVSYIPGSLSDTTLFARIAMSDICPDTSNAVTITVYPTITNNLIAGGTVQYTCFNSPKSLPASLPLRGNRNYSYQWLTSNDNTIWIPAVNNPESDLQNYTSVPLTNTQYFRRIVYSSPDLHECADTSGAVEIRINALPSGDVISSVDTICAGETIHVKFSTAGVHPPFSVTIGDQSVSGITASPDSMAFTPAVTQSYAMLTIADDSGCVANNATFTALAKVVVYQIPVANAGPDGEICSNTYTLQATRSIAGSNVEWTATGAVFTDPHNAITPVTVDQYGPKTFTLTETNWHCPAHDEVQVIFNEQPQPPDAGPDQVLDFSFTTRLGAAVPAVGSGKWTVESGAAEMNNDTLPDAIVSELESPTTLTWTVHNGNCPAVSDQMGIVIKPLVIPKAYSPNGDTKHDYFDLGAVNAENARIKIYNSAGILVFKSDDYTGDNLWDGRNLNGVELPEGTYFYVIDMKVAGRKKEFQFRSFVEILR
jgi:gliding motility-associated-like protein